MQSFVQTGQWEDPTPVSLAVTNARIAGSPKKPLTQRGIFVRFARRSTTPPSDSTLISPSSIAIKEQFSKPKPKSRPLTAMQLGTFTSAQIAALAPEIADGKASADQTANQIIIRVGNIILFDSGSATVLTQFKPVAARVAAALDKEPGYIKVIGHTDNTPISGSNVRFPSNYDLSVERAKNVSALLKTVLAKPDRLQTDGKGETMPVADNKTPEGRARNRRVEILIPREETLAPEQKVDANSSK